MNERDAPNGIPPNIDEMDHVTSIKTEAHMDHSHHFSSDTDDDDYNHRNTDDDIDCKRPRLRLARACDRCKRRKIKCDEGHPCAPCVGSKTQCTFNTPTRRTSKPRVAERPRKNVKDLEARMASLEQQLRHVPNHVHNEALTKLDQHLLNPSSQNDASNSSSSSTTALAPKLTHSMRPPIYAAASGSRPQQSFTSSSDGGIDSVTRDMESMNMSPGFIYLDEMGMSKWQGATSGFPLLQLLAEQERQPSQHSSPSNSSSAHSPPGASPSAHSSTPKYPSPPPTKLPGATPKPATPGSNPEIRDGQGDADFFPDRQPRAFAHLDPEASWKAITGVIPSDLMDTLIRSYLSTTHLLWPFLHVPSFLADYANPSRWGETGFARFIVAVCTLSSRHVDDPRVRANPSDPSSAGKTYFELFKKMQDLPQIDRPTLYSTQARFLVGIYCMGLGTLSYAFMLFAESITMAIDGGLHRDVTTYDIFSPIEIEVRKRTFWSIYCWDKLSGACFGRPAMIHLRDCDVPEPVILDDEYITEQGLGVQPEGTKPCICAFVSAIRLHVVLEGVLDGSVRPSDFASSDFLSKAASVIARRYTQSESLREEESLLEDWCSVLEPHWNYNTATIASKDPVRITQAERLHCLEHLVRMLIFRHRFSQIHLSPNMSPEDKARHHEYVRKAMQSSLTIVASHLHISQRGYMTYYGVHVIHQLAQAGRTLVAVILNCKSQEFRPLITSSIEGLRSCVGLLRRFSGRYICGLRSADILDEFCRICKIPVDAPPVPAVEATPSPAWLRPVRKRSTASPAGLPRSRPSQSVTHPPDIMEDTTSFINNTNGYSDTTTNNISNGLLSPQSQEQQSAPSFGDYHQPDEDTSFFSFVNIESVPNSPVANGSSSIPMVDTSNTMMTGINTLNGNIAPSTYDMSSIPEPDVALGALPTMGSYANDMEFGLPDLGLSGLDNVTATENLSAAEILSLLQDGQFDYSELFPDQLLSTDSMNQDIPGF